MGSSPGQRLTAAERRKKALALQIAGLDLRTIADQVGYADASAAKKGIDRAIEESIARTKDDVDELRRREVMRLDRLQAAFWSPAVKDRDKKAADIVLKCINTRDRLQGLSAPVKVEHSGEITEYHIVGLDPEDLV
ncbi:hypothetical protein [Streptomyces sp. NPDC007346]|uniref:hypothetical protein n=1 Tax=Streptomyces sp. NPDC007346 TaxID=3154682 RepID=UPI003452442F